MNKKKTPEEIQYEVGKISEEMIVILNKYDYFIGVTALQLLLIETFDGTKEKFLEILGYSFDRWKNDDPDD